MPVRISPRLNLARYTFDWGGVRRTYHPDTLLFESRVDSVAQFEPSDSIFTVGAEHKLGIPRRRRNVEFGRKGPDPLDLVSIRITTQTLGMPASVKTPRAEQPRSETPAGLSR